MRRYKTAISRTSSGVFMSVSRGRAIHCPSKRRKKPLISAMEIMVWIASCTFCGLFCPIKCPITTFAPTLSPTNRLTNKLMAELFAPTAANARLLAKCPTTATSAALNNCCRTLLAHRGNANKHILSSNEPESMSM